MASRRSPRMYTGSITVYPRGGCCFQSYPCMCLRVLFLHSSSWWPAIPGPCVNLALRQLHYDAGRRYSSGYPKPMNLE
eukprot:328488-Pyramimonas_sp.AAC.1